MALWELISSFLGWCYGIAVFMPVFFAWFFCSLCALGIGTVTSFDQPDVAYKMQTYAGLAGLAMNAGIWMSGGVALFWGTHMRGWELFHSFFNAIRILFH